MVLEISLSATIPASATIPFSPLVEKYQSDTNDHLDTIQYHTNV